MKGLAAEVVIHQSTLTRIVEKLEKMNFAHRTRKAKNQRMVQVEITDSGKAALKYQENESQRVMAGILALIPEADREKVVESIEILANMMDPKNPKFLKLLASCCAKHSNPCGGDQ